jgi:hypothetical protein
VTKQTTGEEAAAKLLFNKPRIPVAVRLARLIQEGLEVFLNLAPRAAITSSISGSAWFASSE